MSPDPAGGSKLRNLLKEVHSAVEEERQSGGEVVDIKAGPCAELDVFKTIGQCVRKLLERARSSLADVIPADADVVPVG